MNALQQTLQSHSDVRCIIIQVKSADKT